MIAKVPQAKQTERKERKNHIAPPSKQLYRKISMHTAQHSWLRHIRHVDEDIVRRVTVKRCTQAFLVQMVTNETDATSKNEQAIQCTNLDIFFSFLACERPTITEKIDEADSNTSVNVKDELH